MSQTAHVAATIGPNDPGYPWPPRAELLRQISGIEPVPAGTHVMLEVYGVRSTQRLALGDVGGRLIVALWPAELKEQAKYLYAARLARPMIEQARSLEWTVDPAPQLAFRNSAPGQRLYMAPAIDAAAYARRWEDD